MTASTQPRRLRQRIAGDMTGRGQHPFGSSDPHHGRTGRLFDRLAMPLSMTQLLLRGNTFKKPIVHLTSTCCGFPWSPSGPTAGGSVALPRGRSHSQITRVQRRSPRRDVRDGSVEMCCAAGQYFLRTDSRGLPDSTGSSDDAVLWCSYSRVHLGECGIQPIIATAVIDSDVRIVRVLRVSRAAPSTSPVPGSRRGPTRRSYCAAPWAPRHCSRWRERAGAVPPAQPG